MIARPGSPGRAPTADPPARGAAGPVAASFVDASFIAA